MPRNRLLSIFGLIALMALAACATPNAENDGMAPYPRGEFEQLRITASSSNRANPSDPGCFYNRHQINKNQFIQVLLGETQPRVLLFGTNCPGAAVGQPQFEGKPAFVSRGALAVFTSNRTGMLTYAASLGVGPDGRDLYCSSTQLSARNPVIDCSRISLPSNFALVNPPAIPTPR